MKRIELFLPLPPAILHPNSRPHWAAKAKATREARRLAFIEARAAYRQRRPMAVPRLSFTFILARQRDNDGLVAWVKAYIDGLQDAGVFANDGKAELGFVRRVKTVKGVNPGVTILVEDVEQ